MSPLRAGMVLALLLAATSVARAADPWQRLTDAVELPPEQAVPAIEALLLEHPRFAAAHYDLGTLLLPTDAAAAAPHLEAATASADARVAADAWHNLALARLRLGRLEEALAAAVRAADIDAALVPSRDRIRAAVLVALDEARLRAEAEARRLRIPAAELPRAFVGESYEAKLVAAGGQPGSAGYVFALAESPPPGLALAADGRLHGTPTAVGTHRLAVTVADAAGGKASGTVSLTIASPPAISPESLPEAVAGQPYRAELTVSSLERPRWSADGLPAGLSLQTTRTGAEIVGTPQAPGEATVAIAAQDARRGAKRSYRLIVGDAFAPDATTLPPATAWAEYRHRVGVRGPAQEYRWSLATTTTGGAQRGLLLAQDGTVAGVPDGPGDIPMPVTIAAADGRSRAAVLTVPVNPPPVIEAEPTLTVREGEAVDRALRARDGTPPYAWRLVSGTLPRGLRLDPDGSLRGATTAVGEHAVEIGLADRWQAATSTPLTITVQPAPPDRSPPEQPQDQQDQQDQQQQQQQQQDQQQPKDGSEPQDGRDQADAPQDQAGDPGESKPDGQPQQQPKDGEPAQRPPQEPRDDARGEDGERQARDDGTEPPRGADRKPQGEEKDEGERKPPDDAPGGHAAAATPAPSEPQPGTMRFLDQLPAEDREALRGQLLHRSPPPKGSQGRKDPW